MYSGHKMLSPSNASAAHFSRGKMYICVMSGRGHINSIEIIIIIIIIIIRVIGSDQVETIIVPQPPTQRCGVRVDSCHYKMIITAHKTKLV